MGAPAKRGSSGAAGSGGWGDDDDDDWRCNASDKWCRRGEWSPGDDDWDWYWSKQGSGAASAGYDTPYAPDDKDDAPIPEGSVTLTPRPGKRSRSASRRARRQAGPARWESPPTGKCRSPPRPALERS